MTAEDLEIERREELLRARECKRLALKSGNMELYEYWLREVVRLQMLGVLVD